jgi:acetyl/propionyl-CoA carboxylase alpha subunit/acetyl-CoA carboxylase carboxyltransferase component
LIVFKGILIANRGEIAIRIARACADLGIRSVAVYSEDDADALHRVKADSAIALPGRGASAYLDGESLIAAAKAAGCEAIHPGYGFLSEAAAFAGRCEDAGLVFAGPSTRALGLFGDKARAVEHARSRDVPTARTSDGACDLAGALEFAESLNGAGVLIKAVAGGGGRGMRIVRDFGTFAETWRRCASEAAAAFGSGELYVEELIGRARHIEVQILGERNGGVAHLFERECSVQRRFQKIIEIAPSPWLDDAMRQQLIAAALRIVEATGYVGLGTVEFLVEIDAGGRSTGRFVFIEMNPRLQVEHTVTEELTRFDLVQLQLQLAAGATLDQLGLGQDIQLPGGYALQLRINMENMAADGSARPSDGRLTTFEPPSGPGVRIETAAYAGYASNPNFDSLLAKLVVRSPSSAFPDAARRAYRALCEFNVAGVDTNIPVLQNILVHPDFEAGLADTKFVEGHAPELTKPRHEAHPAFHRAAASHIVEAEFVPDQNLSPAEGIIVRSPMQGRVISVEASAGDYVRQGQSIMVIEAMKMEHSVVAEASGYVTRMLSSAGDIVQSGAPLLVLSPDEQTSSDGPAQEADTDDQSEHLDVLLQHQTALLDQSRPEAIERQRARGALTARERIELLCDTKSFVEFGSLAHPEHGSAPADGVVTGTARIDHRPVVVFAQDFTVFGGSVGHLGGSKVDRALAIALANGIPLVMLLDGGGHRIQDGQNSRSYAHGAATFHDFARLSGWVPVVAAVLGAGFAANTNYSGLADFVIMLRGRATMGLAGPALVKAGTGEDISAQALGGAATQVDKHGLADLGVESEQEAMDAVRAFLSYLPSNAQAAVAVADVPLNANEPARAQPLLTAIPANPRKSYDVRPAIGLIADPDSVYEIKPSFARNIVTAFARVEGRAVGFIANQALVAAGMLDSAACEKAAHFVALCDAFGLPLIYLIDVPGFSIGSDAERTTLGRRSARLIYELGHATVPRISIVLRKGYGLGYVAMGGGRSFDADTALAWPTAEICAMSVEGSVDVAYRQDYEAAADPKARRQELIDSIRSRIGPIQAAQGFGIDEIIDPRTTRARLIEILGRSPPRRNNRQPPKYRSISPI